MSSLRDAVRQDLRLRMEEQPCDDDAVFSPIATHPAPGSQHEFAEDEEDREEEIQENDVVLDDDGLAPSNEWMSQAVEPNKPEKPVVEPNKPEQPVVEPNKPEQPVVEPTKPEKSVVEPKKPEQPVVEPKKPEQPVESKPDEIGLRHQESIEFAASDVEEPAEGPFKRPSAKLAPKAKTAAKKRPAAAPPTGSSKKRPASAVECETEETEKPSGPRSVMDVWPWVDIPDGPHLRECKVGEDWQAGLPTQFAVY